MEALNALRESVLSGAVATAEKDAQGNFSLGDLRLPASYKLPYKSLLGKGEFYSVDAVVYLAKKLLIAGGASGFRYGEYVREAKKEGVQTVNIADWKILDAYLSGKVDACEHVFPDQLPEQVVPGGPGVGGAAGGAIKRPRGDEVPGGNVDVQMSDVDADDTLKAIVANELRLRNRNTMLSVPGRSFDAVMDVLYNVGVEEMNRTKRLNAGNVNPNTVTAPRSSGRYQRQTTADAAMRQMGADALGIENVGFGGDDDLQFSQPQQSQQPPPPPPAPYPSGASELPQQKTQQLVVPKPVARSSAPKQPKMTPLILVPPSSSALLNMHNIKRFLEEGVFVPPEEALAANPKKEVYLRCMRREGRDPRRPVKYHVTDKDPSRKEDWDRLVSVGVLGKAWQFKRWPFKGASSGDMVDTFLKVAGVYFHYADEPIDPLIKQWNVKLIPISRHNRANDGTAQRAFWEYVDGFVAARAGLSSRVLT